MTIMNMVGGGTDDNWAEGTLLIPYPNNVEELTGFMLLKVTTSTTPVVFRKGSELTNYQASFSTPGARYMDTSKNIYAYSLFNSDIGKYLNIVFNNNGECVSNITTINPTQKTMTVTTWNIDTKNISGVALDSINGVTVEGAQSLDGEYTFEGVWVIVSGRNLTPTYCTGNYKRTSGRLTAVNGVITMVTFNNGGGGSYYTTAQLTESLTHACHIFTRLNKQ